MMLLEFPLPFSTSYIYCGYVCIYQYIVTCIHFQETVQPSGLLYFANIYHVWDLVGNYLQSKESDCSPIRCLKRLT